MLSHGQTRKHCCGNIISCQCFVMFTSLGNLLLFLCLIEKLMFLCWKKLEMYRPQRNIAFAPKMFLNLLGNIFASWEANFVSATMFSEMRKQGNIDRKFNVSTTTFHSLPRALAVDVNRKNLDGNIRGIANIQHQHSWP